MGRRGTEAEVLPIRPNDPSVCLWGVGLLGRGVGKVRWSWSKDGEVRRCAATLWLSNILWERVAKKVGDLWSLGLHA